MRRVSKVYVCRQNRFCSILSRQQAVLLSLVSSPDTASQCQHTTNEAPAAICQTKSHSDMCEKLSLPLGDRADIEQTFVTKSLCFQIALVLFVTIFFFQLKTCL